MAYKVEFTAEAKCHMEKLIAKSLNTYGIPSYFGKVVDNLTHCLALLSENPELFPFCRDDNLRKKELRKAIVGNYIIIYLVFHQWKTVSVRGIFNARSNYQALL